MSKTSENKQTDKRQKLFQQLDNVTYNSQAFFQRYAKTFITTFTSIILVASGYFAYLKLYLEPRQEEALTELFYAKQYFSQDDLKKSLGGKESKGGYLGFTGIVEKYSSTKAGNISKYYAGVCHYKLGNYRKAIKSLEEFTADDEILPSMKYGIIGDAFAQLKKNNDALEFYLKAAHKKYNTFTTPLYYYKAAILALSINKYKEAKKYFTGIKEKYPNSFFASDVDKYLALINQKLQKSS